MRSFIGHLCTALLMSFLLAAIAENATAHELEPTRAIIAQMSSNYVEIMVLYTEPPGPRASVFLRRFDIDNDRRITGPEATLAAQEMLPQMLHGLNFEVAGEQPRASLPDVKFEIGPDGQISAAAFVRYELSALQPEKMRTFLVHVAQSRDVLPTEIVIRSGEAMQIVSSSLPVASRFDTVPAVLNRGDSARALFKFQPPASE